MYRLLFIEDIHEKKLSELELKQKSEELLEINRQLDRFVYSVSHDLRAPLTSVLGLVHLMKKEYLSPEILHYVDLEEKLLHRLDSFIKDLIDYSRNARLAVEKTEVNLQQMIANTLEQYSFLENFNQLQINCNFNNGNTFLLDASRMNVVINNLISNAIRYLDTSKKSYLNISTQIENKHLKMIFEDNGIGIDAEHINKIFGMFYRANKNKSGSGLGLFIVKESIEKLGGTISVQSKLGEGTVFTLSVPIE
jgi:signal transduction histidine kinase